METKKVKLPTTFAYDGEKKHFTLNVGVPNGRVVDIRFCLVNTDHPSDGAFAFLSNPEDGSLLVQEYWEKENERVFFGINSEGELEAILPEGWDMEVDEEGNLLLSIE